MSLELEHQIGELGPGERLCLICESPAEQRAAAGVDVTWAQARGASRRPDGGRGELR